MTNELKFVDSKRFKKHAKEHSDVNNVAVRKHYIAEEVKSSKDLSRGIDFTISTGAVDRDRDTIDPNGFDLKAFKKNPVVLFAHDNSKPPIGRATKIRAKDGRLQATAEFMNNDIDTSGFSDMIFRMLKEGFLKATSVGFMPVDFDFVETDDFKDPRFGGVDFSKVELLEFSVVPVPSNPEALIEARAKGIDTAPLCGWYEEALDEWATHKDMLLVPKRQVVKLFESLSGNGSKTFHLSRKEQDELLSRNLSAQKGDGEDQHEDSAEKAEDTEEKAPELTLEGLAEEVKEIKTSLGDFVEALATVSETVTEVRAFVEEKLANSGVNADDVTDENSQPQPHGGQDNSGEDANDVTDENAHKGCDDDEDERKGGGSDDDEDDDDMDKAPYEMVIKLGDMEHTLKADTAEGVLKLYNGIVVDSDDVSELDSEQDTEEPTEKASGPRFDLSQLAEVLPDLIKTSIETRLDDAVKETKGRVD